MEPYRQTDSLTGGSGLAAEACCRSGRSRWLGVVAAFLLLAACDGSPSRPLLVVGSPDSPRLRQTVAGLEKGLAPRRLTVVTIPPHGEEGEEILRNLRAAAPPLFIALGTPVLMRLAQAEKRRPIVFAMVANPYFSHAAWDPHRPEFHQLNVTGLVSPPPVAQALRQATSLVGPRTWGLLYDPLDGAALEVAGTFLRASQELGLPALVEESSRPETDASALRRLMARGALVLYLPPTTTAARYADLVLAQGRERRAMVVNGHPEISGQGAILTVTLDYEALGEQAAALALRVLAGEPPARLPLEETQPLCLRVDEALVRHWAGYPPPRR